ncbi:hypothetical protein PtB15_18B468 [Puccinia triticina]|nr:hypothetical protein PtB15_15B196 [Puccinia triticina]WAR63382.1 hypothetical protein PtB15_18B468 [Puccinia triticina]
MSTPDVSHLSTQPAPAPLHVHRIGLSSTPPPTWEETGAVPDDEDLKIAQPNSPLTTPVSLGKPTRKRTTTKRVKHKSSVKPVDLLAKTPAASSTPPAPIPPATLTAQAGLLTTTTTNHQPSLWEDPPQETGSGGSAPGIPPLNAKETVEPPTPGSRSETDGTPLSPLTRTAADTSGSTASNLTPDVGVPLIAHSHLPLPTHDQASADNTRSGEPKSPVPLHLSSSAPASGPLNPTTTDPHQPQTQGSAPASSAPLPHLTIIKSDAIRTQVIDVSQEVAGSKPSWSKYVATWKSMSPLLQHCAQAFQQTPPPSASFHLGRTSCSYTSWIQTIISLADEFLSPSKNEQWYCPDLLDFPLLTHFGDQDHTLPPGSFIPTTRRTQHPESILVRCLYRLHHPPQHVTTDWAKIVAASVEMTADNIFNPAPASSNPTDNHLTTGVRALAYLETLKHSSSTFDPPADPSNSSVPPTQRMHSVDVLHDFRNIIIDVMMAYIILQTHSLSEAPLTAAQKKANNRANRVPTNNPDDTVSRIEPASSALAPFPADAARHLQSYQKKQNFQPLVYFILGGVRGLFITSRDHRIAGASTCMTFIQAMSIIKQHSATTHNCEEPIWKCVSAYLVKMFAPVFRSPDKICSLASVKVPTRYELAEAITTDFLNHWKTLKPTSPFLMPHTATTITGT